MEENTQNTNTQQPQVNTPPESTSEESSGKWNLLYIIVAIVLVCLILKFMLPLLSPHELDSQLFIEETSDGQKWFEWIKGFK